MMTSQPRSQAYFELVRSCCSDPAKQWIDRVYAEIGTSSNTTAFAGAYAAARRRLGTAAITLDSDEESLVHNVNFPGLQWMTLEEVGRATLLLRATECLPPEDHTDFIRDVYQRGDNDERRALLRALSILSDPPRHLAIAIEACRTNVQTVFEGIACENSYPFHYFPDKNFNQLVLKVLFTGVPLRRVMGLEQRITADLVRMTEDYASERRAARRFVPEDIELITANQRVQR